MQVAILLVLVLACLVALLLAVHFLRVVRYRLRKPAGGRERVVKIQRTVRLAAVPLHAKPAPEVRAPTPSLESKEESLEDSIVGEIRERLNEIPPLPQVIQRLTEELADPTSTAQSVARIVQAEPILAVTLLKAVNASFYGLVQEVSSLTQAITLLGYNTVRSLVLHVGLSRLLPRGRTEAGYRTEDLWVHSLAVSLVAEVLAGRVPQVDRGFVSTLGLLHDLGKLVINAKYPKRIEKLWARGASGNLSFLERERELFGADHPRIGAYLAHRWRLPAPLVRSILFHHAPEGEHSLPPPAHAALRVVYLANQIVKFCHVYCEGMEIAPVPPEAIHELGLGSSFEALLTPDVRRAVSSAIAFVDQISPRPIEALRRMVGVHTLEEVSHLESLPPAWLQDPVLESISVGVLDHAATLSRAESERIDLRESRSQAASTNRYSKSDLEIVYPAAKDPPAEFLYALTRFLERSDFDRASRFQIPFLIKLVLSGLAADPTGTVRVRVRKGLEFDLVDVESSSLSFRQMVRLDDLRQRLGKDRAEQVCRALLGIALGPLIHRGWVDKIEVSESGDRYIFVKGGGGH